MSNDIVGALIVGGVLLLVVLKVVACPSGTAGSCRVQRRGVLSLRSTGRRAPGAGTMCAVPAAFADLARRRTPPVLVALGEAE